MYCLLPWTKRKNGSHQDSCILFHIQHIEEWEYAYAYLNNRVMRMYMPHTLKNEAACLAYQHTHWQYAE
jgi:hypothetical protein